MKKMLRLLILRVLVPKIASFFICHFCHTFVFIDLLGFVFRWMLCHTHFFNIQIEGTQLLNIGMSKSVNIVVLWYNFGID
jgi:hypothetical protein